MRSGFSLVELSIVLVILGLLTGGILAGQNLIRAAEIRTFITQSQQFQAAVMTFKDKYFALPGDMNNATDFWGSAGGSGTLGDGCEAATGTGTETCNGTGDGLINTLSVASEYDEKFTFWQHLANAGMIEGSYTGKSNSVAGQSIAGENVPSGKVSNGAWFVDHYGTGNTGNSTILAGRYDNFIFMGQQSTDWPSERILTPEEMWNLDTKMDDGKPARGRVITFWWDECGLGTTNTSYDADYDLELTTVSCTPIIRHLF